MGANRLELFVQRYIERADKIAEFATNSGERHMWRQVSSSEQGQQQERRPAAGGVKESSFWLSQIFMLAATVLGVFLAAQEGLNQAIAFDDLTSRQNNYYLRSSLYSELQSNIAQAKEYAAFVQRASDNTIKQYQLQLDLFVWESMRYSPATLETPSEFISEIQRYYREANDIRQKIERRVYGSEYGGAELLKVTERMEKDVAPKLRANIDHLKKSLMDKGVALD
ncbi:hypothetical protein HCH_04210 [Hahella chejuensis KCTC 2396]|uniref:Uncharacterized protein n=1 Tax=Hahella chejuensis (strain KCTC 2396) TaxID=349521 RepID=Q2SEK7_HAHCH|nr:hypothetical protein HCH_04210 [Hahella chejuensis KCTC 2396]